MAPITFKLINYEFDFDRFCVVASHGVYPSVRVRSSRLGASQAPEMCWGRWESGFWSRRVIRSLGGIQGNPRQLKGEGVDYLTYCTVVALLVASMSTRFLVVFKGTKPQCAVAL